MAWWRSTRLTPRRWASTTSSARTTQRCSGPSATCRTSPTSGSPTRVTTSRRTTRRRPSRPTEMPATVEAGRGEARLAPSTVGSVLLDVGGDMGALIVSALAEQCGEEIELVPRTAEVPLTHTEVRERRLPGGSVYAAVFPGVPSGVYCLRTAAGAEEAVVIVGGEVA